MFKKVNVTIVHQGHVIYRSQGKTIVGIMLHVAATLVTYNNIEIHIELTPKNN